MIVSPLLPSTGTEDEIQIEQLNNNDNLNDREEISENENSPNEDRSSLLNTDNIIDDRVDNMTQDLYDPREMGNQEKNHSTINQIYLMQFITQQSKSQSKTLQQNELA